jgi:ArsR family transcriptional regulator, arsenate/arsenite/antimonite-responsive transcriptional repressor / arsenate reductase (thioredoxin)
MDGLLITSPEVLKLAGHSIRWSILTRLARSDYRVQELVAFLQLPQNLVSYHLRQLRAGNLVTERKSSADERSVYYSLDVEHFRGLYLQAGEQLHPALTEATIEPGDKEQSGKAPQTPLRVLFLCTANSARSQMAEAHLRQLSHGTIEAFSAGSHPAERVHPLAVQVMERTGNDMRLARPKHFDEFRGQHFDAIVTVCDRVREVCPVFPNDPERIHWSFPDPAQVEGSEEAQYHAFEQTSLQLATRIRLLIILLERKRWHPS